MNPIVTFIPSLLFLVKSILAFAFWTGLASAQPNKPNVIIFMADDMGIGDTSAYLGIKLMPTTEAIAKTLKLSLIHI